MSDDLTRVTLNLTARDLENVQTLNELPAIRNRTHAISTSLAFTRYIVDSLRQNGAHLFLKAGSGEYQRIVVPDLVSDSEANDDDNVAAEFG